MVKTCSKCKIEKPVDCFDRGTNKGNYASYCKVCRKIYRKEHYLKNKEKYFDNARRYKENNPFRKQETDRARRFRLLEEIRAYDKFRFQRDKDKRLALSREWAKNNPERRREIGRKWTKNNPEHVSIQANIRHRRISNATPKWLTQEQLDYMKYLRKLASNLSKETGIPHEVDHIHPVRGKNFCGLHVPWNLRIITRQENMAKGNKLLLELVL